MLMVAVKVGFEVRKETGNALTRGICRKKEIVCKQYKMRAVT